MELTIARKAGFCFGVRRAIRMVEEALEGRDQVYSLGPVIHNPPVIKQLKEKGLRVVDSLDEIENGTVVIRSHGAPPHTHRSIKEKGLNSVDATCPFVKKMHHKARALVSKGYQVIIVGDRNHSEITSLTDDPGFRGVVVSQTSELEGIELSKKIGLISQTTQPIENLREVAGRILPESSELLTVNTICGSTTTRQMEAKKISAQVQAMIVIGGHNSANTRRLVEICQESGTLTFWVETAAEIDRSKFEGIESIGLTAGASTPEWIIKEVVSDLQSVQSRKVISGTTLPAGRHFK